jgi:hypothetical protein
MGGTLSIGGLEFSVYNQDDPLYKPRTKERTPHRCDDRVEDFCHVLVNGLGQYRENLPRAWHLMMECFKSPEGYVPQARAYDVAVNLK